MAACRTNGLDITPPKFVLTGRPRIVVNSSFFFLLEQTTLPPGSVTVRLWSDGLVQCLSPLRCDPLALVLRHERLQHLRPQGLCDQRRSQQGRWLLQVHGLRDRLQCHSHWNVAPHPLSRRPKPTKNRRGDTSVWEASPLGQMRRSCLRRYFTQYPPPWP